MTNIEKSNNLQQKLLCYTNILTLWSFMISLVLSSQTLADETCKIIENSYWKKKFVPTVCLKDNNWISEKVSECASKDNYKLTIELCSELMKEMLGAPKDFIWIYIPGRWILFAKPWESY